MISTTSTIPSSPYFTPISATDIAKSASTLSSSPAVLKTLVASRSPASSTTLPAASSSPDIGSEIDSIIPLNDEQAYLDDHNEYRAKHEALPLSWNSTLAMSAQQWADRCQFIHSGGPYGGQFSLFRVGSKMSFLPPLFWWIENLAAGTGPTYDIAQAITSWTDESSEYRWLQNPCHAFPKWFEACWRAWKQANTIPLIHKDPISVKSCGRALWNSVVLFKCVETSSQLNMECVNFEWNFKREIWFWSTTIQFHSPPSFLCASISPEETLLVNSGESLYSCLFCPCVVIHWFLLSENVQPWWNWGGYCMLLLMRPHACLLNRDNLRYVIWLFFM